MSTRRINSTGRMKILREDARFTVHTGADGVLTFDAALNLADYGLPDDARVFVEAYRQTTFMRFLHGTVAAPQPAHGAARSLSEFSSPDGLLFRVKVTATGERAGVLLAEGDGVPVSDDEEQPDNRIPLLPPVADELGQETWRVDLSGSNGPLLLINRRVGDWKAVAASPIFRSLAYPAAMRQVLCHICKVDRHRDTDDRSDWRSRWLSFAAALPSVPDPPLASDDNEEWEEWINEAVESFARQHQMLDHYREYSAAEASS